MRSSSSSLSVSLLQDKDNKIDQQGKEITFLRETRNRTEVCNFDLEFKNFAFESTGSDPSLEQQLGVRSEETLSEENGPTMCGFFCKVARTSKPERKVIPKNVYSHTAIKNAIKTVMLFIINIFNLLTPERSEGGLY